MLDRHEFRTGLEQLADVFGVRLTEARFEAYLRTLGSYFTADTWSATVKRAGRDCERFPVPKVLIELRGGPEAVELHACSLCSDRPGWVPAKTIKTVASICGKFEGIEQLVMQPCPRRDDNRARAWYAERAEAHRCDIREECEEAEATARALSATEAARLLGRIDPDNRLGFQGESKLSAEAPF